MTQHQGTMEWGSKNNRNTTLLQQVYNSPLTWGGPHTLWGPPHMRGLLYTCCKNVVRELVLVGFMPWCCVIVDLLCSVSILIILH